MNPELLHVAQEALVEAEARLEVAQMDPGRRGAVFAVHQAFHAFLLLHGSGVGEGERIADAFARAARIDDSFAVLADAVEAVSREDSGNGDTPAQLEAAGRICDFVAEQMRAAPVAEPAEIKSSWAVVQDHTRQFSDYTYVYPVISRRSRGLSIGVNLNPDKVCNFDCVYCEVDRRVPGKVSTVNVEQMREELRALVGFARDGRLAKEPKFNEVPWLTRDVKDIAFSGDGEPTMVHNFAACVQAVVEVKRELGLDQTKLVLITDAAGLDKADVKRGLELMDANRGEIWAKLDAGTEPYYKLVNRSNVRFERILANLLLTARTRPVIIQSLFFKVRGEPMGGAELEAYCGRLNDIVRGGGAIREVHAYTIARPTPEAWATRLEPGELAAIAATVRARTGLAVQTFE
jgi:wyosine [tRNA(Phe)-imidazoG37] synthetase (radical SAM superfamily)